MAEIEFQGDWDPAEAQRIAMQLQKSFGVGPGQGGEALVYQDSDNPIGRLVSKRHRKLIELLKSAGAAAFELELEKSAASPGLDGCDEPDEVRRNGWLTYGWLGKSTISLPKADTDVSKNGQSPLGSGMPELEFQPKAGMFGRGVYFPICVNPGSHLTVRLRLEVDASELIDQNEFNQIEDDLGKDLDQRLTAKGVKAVAQLVGEKVTLLMVRDPGLITNLGVIGEGDTPEGQVEYQLVKVEPAGDHFTIDVELVGRGEAAAPLALEKAVKRSRNLFGGALSGAHVVPNGKPALDRQVVRSAVARCKKDGVPVGEVAIRLTDGCPDFLEDCAAFCLPGEGTVFLAAHDPLTAIARQTRMLTAQLQSAVKAGALDGDHALEVLHKASKIDPQWWLESLIKRYVGAILCSRVGDVMNMVDPVPWRSYIGLLAGRGLEHWGDRQAIARCMAEDYRCIHDPEGLPNQVTMVWDLLNPAQARFCQDALMLQVNNRPFLEPLKKSGRKKATSPGQMNLFDESKHPRDESGKFSKKFEVGAKYRLALKNDRWSTEGFYAYQSPALYGPLGIFVEKEQPKKYKGLLNSDVVAEEAIVHRWIDDEGEPVALIDDANIHKKDNPYIIERIDSDRPLSKSGGERAKRILSWNKLKIGLSHEPGDHRHGRKMKAGYGHIRGSYGDADDGMAIDVYVGPDLGSSEVFKVKQMVNGEFDEFKYIIGCWDATEAKELYLAHMPKQFFGGIEPVPMKTLERYKSRD